MRVRETVLLGIALVALLLAFLAAGWRAAVGPEGPGGPPDRGAAGNRGGRGAAPETGEEAEGPAPRAIVGPGDPGGAAADEETSPAISCRVLDPRGWPAEAEVRCGEEGRRCRDEQDGEYACFCGPGVSTVFARSEGVGEGSVTAAAGDRVVIRLVGYGRLRFDLVSEGPLPARVVVVDRAVEVEGRPSPGGGGRPEPHEDHHGAAVREGGEVEVWLVPGVHEAEVQADGGWSARLEPFTLDPGQVHDAGTVVLVAPGKVVGRVVDAAGRPQGGAWVEAGDGLARTACDDEGHFQLAVGSGERTLRALRLDGLLTVRSDPVTVRVRPDEDAEVTLVLPDHRTGGLGIQIASREGGVVVEGILPGGPGEEIGLKEGDVLVSVDGEAVAGSLLEDLVDRITGAEGSALDLEVRRGEATLALRATRRVIEDRRSD